MYEILIGDLNGNNSTLYYPNDEEYVVYDTELSLKVGVAGTFEFIAPNINPNYTRLKQGAIITILRDDAEFWRGEIIEVSKDFNGNASVYCVEDLAWLGMEYIAPSIITNETYIQRFRSVIGLYNQHQVGTERKFEIGYVSNVQDSGICKWATTYEQSILDSIRSCIAGDTGYVRVRRTGGKRYIDVVKLQDYGVAAEQSIQFAENLLDYAEEMNMGNFTNVIYPYGKELDEELYEGVNKRLAGTVISNNDSINRYGRHAKTVCFDTDNINTLNSLAQAYLTRYSQPQLSFNLTAIDLSDISNDTRINLGDSVRVIAEPFGIDQWIYLTEQTIDIQDVGKSTFVLASYISKGRTLTEQTISVQEAVEDIPSKTSILDSAKKNALELLSGANGGYLSFLISSNGQINGFQITNTQDASQASQKWVWNENGLGYMYKNSQGAWVTNNAMTKDGQIVADRITTGVMSADRISGGTIDATKVSVTNLNASNITSGSMSAGRITSGTMSADRISGGTIDANNVTINNLNASKITSGTMSADKISGGTIDASKVTVSNLNANNITTGTLSGVSIVSNNATITGGSINISTASDTDDIITFTHGNTQTRIETGIVRLGNPNGQETIVNTNGLFFYGDGHNAKTVISPDTVQTATYWVNDFNGNYNYGKSGSFVDRNGKTITVQGGIITKIG